MEPYTTINRAALSRTSRTPRDREGGTVRRPFPIISIFWFLLSYTILAFAFSKSSSLVTLVGLGGVHAIASAYTFLRAGGRTISVASMLSFGNLVFVAYAALYTGVGLYPVSQFLEIEFAVHFLTISFLFQLGLLAVSSSRRLPRKSNLNFSGGAVCLSLLLLTLTFLTNRFETLAPLNLGITCFCIALLSIYSASRPRLSAKVVGYFTVMTILGAYYVTAADGFGRLVIVTLLAVVAVSTSLVFSSYSVKTAMLIALVPSIHLLSLQRLSFLQDERGSANELEGIGSVVGPFQSAAIILQSSVNGAIAPTHGSSFLTSVLFWVPRQVWPGKPAGYGREIVYITQPNHVAYEGHSSAAPFLSEFVWNFGLLGLGISMVVLLVAVKGVDKWLVTVPTGNMDSNLRLVVHVLLVASTLNYVWGGSFTWATRSVGLFIAAVILLLSKLQIFHRRSPE